MASFSRRERTVVNRNPIGFAKAFQLKKEGVADGSYPFTVLQPMLRQFVSLSVAILSAMSRKAACSATSVVAS